MPQAIQVQKPSRTFYAYLNDFVDYELQSETESSPKFHQWNMMKNELEIAGYPNEVIGKMMKNEIEETIWEKKYKDLGVPRNQYKWHNGHFYRWCKSAGLSNIFTKSPTWDTSIYTPIMQRLDCLKTVLSIAKQKFSENPQVTLNDDELEEWDTMLQILDDSFNEKEKVPMNTEHLLLFRAATSVSMFHAAVAFFEDRLFQLKKARKLLTDKQIGYYQTNDIKKQLQLFRPDSRDSAIFQKYYGVQCEKCHSWRVKEMTDSQSKGNNVICKDCTHAFQAKTVNKCRYCQMPLYREDLKLMIKTHNQQIKNGKEDAEYPCPECNSDNRLPQEMVDYAIL